MNKIIERAIFFDLDGTLWDALQSIMETWNNAMKNNHLLYRFSIEQIRSYMGLTAKEIADIAFKDVDEETRIKYFDYVSKEQVDYLYLHPGYLFENEVEVLLNLKKKYPLFIVSNCNEGYIDNYLNCIDKTIFTDTLCAGQTKRAKWENILLLKQKYNIKNVIYVGDTLKDYLESKKANVSFIHAAYGFGDINDNVYKINSFDELENIIEEVFNYGNCKG